MFIDVGTFDLRAPAVKMVLASWLAGAFACSGQEPRGAASPQAGASRAVDCQQECDVSSDKNAQTAFESMTGEELGDRPCFYRLDDALIVASFADNLGCIPVGVIIDCCAYTPVASSARPILERRGWSAADPETRSRLAEAWIREVDRAMRGDVLDEPPHRFARSGRKFEPPNAMTETTGEIRIVTWLDVSTGQEPGPTYAQVEYRFNSSGELVAREELDRFDLPR